MNFPYRIRQIEPEKDAAAIADLVTRSFRPWLEGDNLDYLKNLHEAGIKAKNHPFLTKLTGFPYSIPGIVCVDSDENVLGLINTYAFYQKEKKCNLLANVCVDPAYRGKGIASEMLRKLFVSQKEEGTYGLYLQARTEQADTIRFYRKNGFKVTDYRETWIRPAKKSQNSKFQEKYNPEAVPPADTALFKDLFQNRYPECILWNLDYREDLFRTGRLNEFRNWLFSTQSIFRRITDRDETVKAWYTLQQLNENTNQLWFIPNSETSPNEQSEILNCIVRNQQLKKALKLDVPFGEDKFIYEAAGFTKLHTLAWMFKRL